MSFGAQSYRICAIRAHILAPIKYIMEMSNLVTRLKTLKLELSEDILVHLCVQEERLKQEKIESAHLASTSQGHGTNKKRKRDNKGKQTAYFGTFEQKVQKKQDKEITCFFCKKAGHMKKACTKYAAWREKKGTLLNFVCSEINLAIVPIDTWWIDTGTTTHISVMMHGCLRSRMPTYGERYIYVGNNNKAAVKAIAKVENQLGKKIKVVKSDCGGEYYGRYEGSGEQHPRSFTKYLMYKKPSIMHLFFFEMGNAKFIEDVELSGRKPLRNVVFEEESVNIPIIATGHGHIMFDDAIWNIQPITQIVDTPEIPPTQVVEPVQVHEETKRDSKGNIVRYKARLVTKGFTQKEDIDYKETFSPVSPNDSFRIIMELVAHYDLELHQMDVKTAFLNGNIDETIYMVQSENFESNDSKQLENTVDQCIYLKFSGSKFIILMLYVDDILVTSSDMELLHETKRFLSSKFDMKDLGNASFMLGIQIYRDRSRGILGLSQKSYIDKMLSRFGMSNCAPRDTPVTKGDKFSLHQCPRNELERNDIERFPYASTVGSLMYAQVCTRSDIAYIVGMLGRYLSNPGMDHWKKAKQVMRYLQRTKDYILTYRISNHLEIVGYSDSNFAGCLDNRRSTSGYIFMLAGGAVSWKSVKQTFIASSTMKAKFIACYETSNHGI
ncbi:hypothetical protein AAG906_031960 [Vitis piasezkii]